MCRNDELDSGDTQLRYTSKSAIASSFSLSGNKILCNSLFIESTRSKLEASCFTSSELLPCLVSNETEQATGRYRGTSLSERVCANADFF